MKPPGLVIENLPSIDVKVLQFSGFDSGSRGVITSIGGLEAIAFLDLDF